MNGVGTRPDGIGRGMVFNGGIGRGQQGARAPPPGFIVPKVNQE